jgi:hypothetical protein
VEDPRAELERALALENETEQKLAVAAVVNELVRPLGFRAVVIGGLAVEFWTRGDYTTADIDLYMPWTPQVDVAFASVGFIKEGRHWTVPEHDVFVEAPASALGEKEAVHEVVLTGGHVAVVLALEDVLIDRLHQFVAGGYRDVTSQAIALLGSEELDLKRLEARARDEGLEFGGAGDSRARRADRTRRNHRDVGAPRDRTTASARAIINVCGESSSETGWPGVTKRGRASRGSSVRFAIPTPVSGRAIRKRRASCASAARPST